MSEVQHKYRLKAFARAEIVSIVDVLWNAWQKREEVKTIPAQKAQLYLISISYRFCRLVYRILAGEEQIR